jgi:hypothetical protein
MKKPSNVDFYISHILKMMEKAMPEIRRQVEVYEINVKKWNSNKK